ncbi:class I SAM-dependent DNA methyltransferase [Planctomycetota bacterium]
MKSVDCNDFHWDGRHYDLQNSNLTEDISFYSRQSKKYNGSVLELACGTGRITIPLAKNGIQITGLDVSASMLAHAEKKAAGENVQVEWIKADCRDFSLKKKFNLIFFPFNSIAHLHDLESIIACFSCIKNHLADQGRFIVDFFNPCLEYFTRDASKRHVNEYPDPDGNGTIVISENNIYDSATQINHIKWYFKLGNKEFVKDLNMRIYYPQELDALHYLNGFTIENKYGNYDETLFTSKSPKQLVISHCEARC